MSLLRGNAGWFLPVRQVPDNKKAGSMKIRLSLIGSAD
jgi:hypothetical protein